MRILNPFRAGLFAGLGVLVAVAIGSAILSLGTVLTYVGAALFLALGLDPLVTWLERHRVPRWAAILIVLVVVAGVVVGFMFAIVPVIAAQVTGLLQSVPAYIASFTNGEAGAWVAQTFPWLDVHGLLSNLENWVTSLDYTQIGTGVLSFGVTVVTGIAGTLIVVILTIYFTASISSIKRALYRLVPASRRPLFIDIAEEVATSVGRFVMGQGALGILNGLLSAIMYAFIFPWSGVSIAYPALLAFIALLGSLIPLVGTISATVVNTLLALVFGNAGAALAVGIYSVVYMQVEAYVVSPRVMAEAVKVPGSVVVIAALAGGVLLGLLGALIALPVAAAIILIIKRVVIPRQDAL